MIFRPTPQVDHTEVFFMDDSNGWAFARFDADGFQIGEAACMFHRADCVAYAKVVHPEVPCRVFKKDGSLNFTKEF